MAFRKQILLTLAALLLLVAAVAHAGSAAVTAQPLATFASPPQLCPAAGFPAGLGAPGADALEVCGACSDAICVGKAPGSVCGDGFRCLVSGMCSATAIPHCKCLNI